jgi:hypothetical protein
MLPLLGRSARLARHQTPVEQTLKTQQELYVPQGPARANRAMCPTYGASWGQSRQKGHSVARFLDDFNSPFSRR